jgi:hypothetical protein
MIKGKNVNVVPHGGKWAVKTDGSKRADSVFDTQKQAINRGRGLAQRNESEFRIHGKDGRIRDCDSYGNDPYPPKDKVG